MTTQTTKLVKKTRFFLDFDKEEAWLNRMADDGYLLRKRGLRYTFAPVAPGTAVVRVDYRSSMKQADFDDYVRLFEDAGWRHLHGARHGGPQYFASQTAGAGADIFSDHASKAQRYRRSVAAYGAVLVMFLVFSYSLWPPEFLVTSPREWYVTEGLWDMQGAEFLGAFAFESFFVLFRVGVPLSTAGILLYCAAVVAYQSALYARARHE